MDRQVDPRRPRVKELSRGVPAGASSHWFIPVLLLALVLLAGCELLPGPETALSPPANSLAVSFIDVGQGDATLVQSGGKNYLVDGGKSEAGREVVDFLRSRGVESLDDLVATRPYADHIGGLPEVLDALDVATVHLLGDTEDTAT